MEAREELQHATLIYKMVCKTLDDRNWEYEKDDEKLLINTTVRGEDLPMSLLINISTEKELVTFGSVLPFDVPAKSIEAIAIATCMVNDVITYGHFDYDITKGLLYFTITTCYVDSILSTELFDRIIDTLCYTVDKFNDKFLIITKLKVDSIEKIAEILSSDNGDDDDE